MLTYLAAAWDIWIFYSIQISLNLKQPFTGWIDLHGNSTSFEPLGLLLLYMFKQCFSEPNIAWNFWLIGPEGSCDDLTHVLKLHLKSEYEFLRFKNIRKCISLIEKNLKSRTILVPKEGFSISFIYDSAFRILPPKLIIICWIKHRGSPLPICSISKENIILFHFFPVLHCNDFNYMVVLPGGVTARFNFSLQSMIGFHSGSPMLLVSSHPKNIENISQRGPPRGLSRGQPRDPLRCPSRDPSTIKGCIKESINGAIKYHIWSLHVMGTSSFKGSINENNIGRLET